MKRGFNQMGDDMGMCQSDATPVKRPCSAMYAFPAFMNPTAFPSLSVVPHAQLSQDECMPEGDDDSDYSEHYRAYKEWWLNNAQLSCGAIAPE